MKRWVFGIVLFIALIVAVGWGMVSAPILANYSWSIELHRQLYGVIYPKMGLDYKSLPFGIMPMLAATDEESYVYTLLGKVVGVDTAERLLQVQTKNGAIYSVRYSLSPGIDLMYRVKGEGGWKDLVQGKDPLGVDSKVMVQWSDKRKLSEILEAARGDGERKLVNPKWNEEAYLRVIKLE